MKENVRVAEKIPENKKENESYRIPKVDFSQPSGSFADRVMFLQRTIGNNAVERLIMSGTLQAKLRIGQPWDEYEQEADRVAEQVMKMPESSISEKMNCAKESIQRKCPKLEEYEKMHRKPQENGLQAQRSRTPEIIPELEAEINSISGKGQSLPESVRSFFEPRFGYDFNSVHVHADNRADRLSRSVNALAFTAGRNIFFSSGAYNPASRDGLHLLAHELTHTVQQTGGLKAKQFSQLPCIQMKCAACEEELQRSLDISSTSELIQREIWDLTGPDAASCKEKIAEDAAVCSDHANTACSAGGATIAGGGALVGAGIGSVVPGVGTLIGGGIGLIAGIIGGTLGYGKCMEVANAKCRAIGRQKARECDQQFAQQQPIDLGNVEDWSENQP